MYSLATTRTASRLSTNRNLWVATLIIIIATTTIVSPASYISNTMGKHLTHTTTVKAATVSAPTVVVSTTIPNVTDEEDAEIQEAVATEARRQLTLEEEIADQIAYEKEQERLRKLELKRKKRIAFINSVVCNPDDISRVTGLEKISDYKCLTEGTWWSGHEQALYDLEHTYGINAAFAMSVSTLESGSGTSTRANSRHNYYGIELSTVWNSLDDNTLYWGGLINRVYVSKGLTSVWSIGPVYCPPNREWENFMASNMQSLRQSLINNLMDTVE